MLRVYTAPAHYVLRCEHEIFEDLNESAMHFVTSLALQSASRPLRVMLDFCPPTEMPVHQGITASNICGTLPAAIFLRDKRNPAWIYKKTAMGMSHVCYTLQGHFTLMGNGTKLVFRGATSPSKFAETAATLFHASKDDIQQMVAIQLAVLSCTLDRCVVAHRDCVLEHMLTQYPWCRVGARIEELYNSILFHIVDFAAFMADTGIRAAYSDQDWEGLSNEGGLPCKATVSVTRRGKLSIFASWYTKH
jgi:hypothetical protein